MSQPYLGEIRIFSFNFAPRGWAQCNGQLLAINQNQALFSILGTTYGGNGTTNFALPNFQGRVPMHWGSGVTIGQTGGAYTHTLTVNEMPTHNHPLNANAGAAGQRGLAGNMLGAAGFNLYGTGTPAGTLDTSAVTSAGGSQGHPNLQPYTVFNLCIALQGIFPSRN